MGNTHTEDFQNSKKLSLFKAVFLAIASLMGSGIYVLIGITAEIAGPSVIVALLFDLIVAIFVAGCYAECASVSPVNGGGFVYAVEAYGNKALIIGWVMWLSNIAYASLLCITVGIFIADLFGITSISFIVLIGLAVLLLFTVVNIFGSEGLSTVQKPLTIALIGSLLVGAIYLLLKPPQGDFLPLFPNGFLPMFIASSLLFDIFIGFEDVASISEEVKNPKKNIPKALFLSLIIAGIIDMFVVISLFISTRLILIGNSQVPLLDAVRSNSIIYLIVYLGSIFSLLGAMGVAIMAASRNVNALSKYDFLDRKWGKINKKHESPVNAIWLSFLVAVIIVITGKVDLIASISNITYLVTVIFVGLAVIKFRRTKKYENDTFKIPFYPLSVYLCIGFSLFLIILFQLSSILVSLAWLLIGVIIYLFFNSKKRIFGTLFLIATFFIAIQNIFYGIIVIVIGILFYLFTIADKHSVIITLAGVKFVAVIILGVFIYLITNFSTLSSAVTGFTFFFKNILLGILISILIFSLITIVLDVIPLHELVHFFVKNTDSGKFAIQIGKSQIISLEKSQIKGIYLFNKIIGILQLILCGFISFIVIIIYSKLILIESICFASVTLNAESSQFLFISTNILFGISLLFSGFSWLHFNKVNKEI